MAQLSVIPFDRIGVHFASGDHIDAPVILQALIGIQSIAVAALGFGCFIHHRSDHFLGSLPDHFEAQIAAGSPIYKGDDKDLVFFVPDKGEQLIQLGFLDFVGHWRVGLTVPHGL